jgi:hypothetical protein
VSTSDESATPTPTPDEPATPTTSGSTCKTGSSSFSHGYANSIAVLGHSGATGENSDPSRPGIEVRKNSWATGTNPVVDSVYLRTLAKNPKVKGCNFNLAQSSATVEQIKVQAQDAIAMKPKPALFLIQTLDADIVCPAKPSDYAGFRKAFISVLRVLATGAPKSKIFVVSQFGSPGTQATTFTRGERQSIGATGPCDGIDLDGHIVPKKIARLDAVIHGYEAQLEAGCALFSQCRYDPGAFGSIIDKREYVSDDLNHFSIKGHAKAAAVAWGAMQRTGLVPGSG